MSITNKILTGEEVTKDEMIKLSYEPEVEQILEIRGMKKFIKLFKNLPNKNDLSPEIKYLTEIFRYKKLTDDEENHIYDKDIDPIYAQVYNYGEYDKYDSIYCFICPGKVFKTLNDLHRPSWFYKNYIIARIIGMSVYEKEYLKKCPELKYLFKSVEDFF